MKNAITILAVLLCSTLTFATQVPATPPDVAAPPDDAECTDSGLCSKVLEAGSGSAHPDAWDNVTVHYTGWTTDGTMFDSSFKRGKPATFGLNRVIPGWTEGLQLMVAGEKRRLWIPVELAYNNMPNRPKGMLVFDVELISIDDQPEPPPPPATPKDVAAPPEDVETTPSGLASKVLEAGSGTEHPTANSKVTVNYSGWTTDGKLFDSSITRGKPVTFPLNRVIAGWTEGLQLMVKGEKRRFWIPENLAYQGRAGAPQGMLVFDVELLEIEHMPEPPPTPKDVAAPPDDAKKTASGLASKVLQAGTGTEHPTATSRVTVHYTGWTTDGKLFDSSVSRGNPTTFGLNQVIPGWTEGLQLMVEGEKRRFWIPVELAYNNAPGKPKGMLVFDVELIGIK